MFGFLRYLLTALSLMVTLTACSDADTQVTVAELIEEVGAKVPESETRDCRVSAPTDSFITSSERWLSELLQCRLEKRQMVQALQINGLIE